MQDRTSHISRRPMEPTNTIQDIETLCGHISLNIQCINPQDFQRGTLPEKEVCFHCRQTAKAHPEVMTS